MVGTGLGRLVPPHQVTTVDASNMRWVKKDLQPYALRFERRSCGREACLGMPKCFCLLRIDGLNRRAVSHYLPTSFDIVLRARAFRIRRYLRAALCDKTPSTGRGSACVLCRRLRAGDDVFMPRLYSQQGNASFLLVTTTDSTAAV